MSANARPTVASSTLSIGSAYLPSLTDFPEALGQPEHALPGIRKRIVRLMLEDVTLIKDKEITAHLRFKGGATRTITLPRPVTAAEMWKTSPEIVAVEIDRLLELHTTGEIANILNERGLSSGARIQVFTGNMVIGTPVGLRSQAAS